MDRSFRGARIVPALFGAALLLVTVAAAAGASGAGVATVQATACAYSAPCPTGDSGLSETTVFAILGLLALVALLLGVVLLRGRRGGGRRPPTAWSDAGPSGGAVPPGEGAAVVGGAAGAAAYTESPEDVSVAPAEVPTPAATGGESDIDSLMSELDKISGEILKRGQAPKKDGTPPPSSSDDPDEP